MVFLFNKLIETIRLSCFFIKSGLIIKNDMFILNNNNLKVRLLYMEIDFKLINKLLDLVNKTYDESKK